MRIMKRAKKTNVTNERFAHVDKIFSEMNREELQAKFAENAKVIKRKLDALMKLHMSDV